MATVRRAVSTRTITVAASKGGVGKSTVAAALAAQAAAEGARVALIDTDPQGSLQRWWELRGKPASPALVTGVERIAEAVELLTEDGWEWIIIDTPPALIETIEEGIAVADLVIVPVRASALDVEAIGPVVDLCRMHERPFVFVINAAEPRWRLTATAADFLAGDGPVLPEMLSYRQAYIAAMTLGKTGPEVERDGKSKDEVAALWRAIKTRVRQAMRVR
jgi:chromosome partitioning protein